MSYYVCVCARVCVYIYSILYLDIDPLPKVAMTYIYACTTYTSYNVYTYVFSILGLTQSCCMILHQKYVLLMYCVGMSYHVYTIVRSTLQKSQSQNTHMGKTALMLTQRYILFTLAVVQNILQIKLQ